jgi:hypothetical protein
MRGIRLSADLVTREYHALVLVQERGVALGTSPSVTQDKIKGPTTMAGKLLAYSYVSQQGSFKSVVGKLLE